MTRDEYIAQLVASAPPISPSVRAQLYVLLAPARHAFAAHTKPDRTGKAA
jgi:hypothetical protein